MPDDQASSAAHGSDRRWHRSILAYVSGIPGKLCLPLGQWLRIVLLGLLVAVIFVVASNGDFSYITHYRIQRTSSGILRFSLYVGTYFVQCMLLGKLLFSDRNWIRFTGLGLLFPLMILHFSYLTINGTALGLADVETIAREGAGLGGEAIRAFKGSILGALAKAALLVGFLGLVSRPIKIRFSAWKSALLSLSFPAMLVIFGVTEFSVISFPVPFRVMGLFLLHGVVQPYTGSRDTLEAAPSGPSYRKHIVLIVDESIRGDHLWINGYPRDTTPFLAGLGDRLINLGICASGSNCSCSSNQILLGGLMAKDIPIDVDRLNRMPTLFDYARRAGFRTVCLDTQDSSREFILPNMAPSIDKKYTITPEVAKFQRDQTGLPWLANELKSSASTFCYVIKNGAHFRYEGQVPPSELEKQPFGPLENLESRDGLVNSYDTVVRWACDDYLKRVYEICKDKDVLVIYTSDHGQNLLDDARFVSTHCVAREPNSEQANVPLLLLDFGRPKGSMDLRLGPRSSQGAKASHFQIFPTLLRAMGYAETFCADKFGQDLFSNAPTPGPRYFYSGGITRKGVGLGIGKPLLTIGAPSFANVFIDKPAYCPSCQRP